MGNSGLSVEEEAKITAKHNFTTQLVEKDAQKKEEAAAIAKRKEEKEAKKQADKEEYERVITNEDEAWDLFTGSRIAWAVVDIFLLLIMTTFAVFCKQYGLTEESIMSLTNWADFIHLLLNDDWDRAQFIMEVGIGIPILIYGVSPIFAKIAMYFARNSQDIGVIGKFIQNYANVYTAAEDRIRSNIRTRIEGKSDNRKRKKDFLSMGRWFWVTTFVWALFKKQDVAKVETPQPEKYSDRITERIDSLLRIQGHFVFDMDSGVQIHESNGRFGEKEKLKRFPQLVRIENNTYVYTFPMAFEVQKLIADNGMFSQEMKRDGLDVQISVSPDNQYILFTIFQFINLEGNQIYNWYDYTQVFDSNKPLEIPIAITKYNTIYKIPSLDKHPHLLIAGGSGSGKSIAIATIEMGYIYCNRPKYFSVVVVDLHKSSSSEALKDSVFNYFKGKIFDTKEEALVMFETMIHEMEYRIGLIGSIQNVQDIDGYNRYATENNIDPIRRIVIFFEEFSSIYGDLLGSDKERFRRCLERIGKEGRKYGIHIIAIEQNPTADVMPTSMKNQMGHICMRVATSSMSNVVLGHSVDGITADRINKDAKGVALIPEVGMVKFFAIPESDQRIGLKGRFNDLGGLVKAIEQGHRMGDNLSEEYIDSITHISDSDRELLGLTIHDSIEVESSQEEKNILLLISNEVNVWIRYCKEKGGEDVPRGDICMVLFASHNGNINSKSWSNEFCKVSGVSRDSFRDVKLSLFLGLGILKKEKVDAYHKNLLAYDLQASMNMLIHYYSNLNNTSGLPIEEV